MKQLTVFNTFIHPSASLSVRNVLQSGMLSEGEKVAEFESLLEAQIGMKNCVTVNSGTSALHLALVLAGIGEDDEVIIPAQTFIATGLTVLYCRARPVFADIDYNTGNISASSIREKITPRTKAIIPVHWGGYPCDLDEIRSVAQEYGLQVIEDAAHALGARYRGQPIGGISDYTCFSFQSIKHVTTGDGGAVCCLSDTAYREAIRLRWFGIDRRNTVVSELGERQYDAEVPGYKYHLNNFAAALGITNLAGFGERLKHRRILAEYYRKALPVVPGVTLWDNASDRESAWWLFGMHVERRLEFIRKLKEHGIGASVVHQRIDRNSVFGGLDSTLINQSRFDDTQIHIPLHDGIMQEDAERIVSVIKQGW